jgi:hypothetical protein
MEAELTSETPFSFNETLRRYHLRITTSNPNVWRHVTTRTVRMAIHMAQVAQDHSESVTSPSPVFECDAIWMRVFATARNEGAPSGLVTSLATYTHPNLVVCVCVCQCVPPRPLPWPPPLSHKQHWLGALPGGLHTGDQYSALARAGLGPDRLTNWGGALSSPSLSQLYAQGRYLWQGEG